MSSLVWSTPRNARGGMEFLVIKRGGVGGSAEGDSEIVRTAAAERPWAPSTGGLPTNDRSASQDAAVVPQRRRASKRSSLQRNRKPSRRRTQSRRSASRWRNPRRRPRSDHPSAAPSAPASSLPSSHTAPPGCLITTSGPQELRTLASEKTAAWRVSHLTSLPPDTTQTTWNRYITGNHFHYQEGSLDDGPQGAIARRRLGLAGI